METSTLALNVNLLNRLFRRTAIVNDLFLNIDVLVQRSCVLLLLEILPWRWAVTRLSRRLLNHLHTLSLFLVDLVNVDPRDSDVLSNLVSVA